MLQINKRYNKYISAKRISEGSSGTGFCAKIKRILGHHNTKPNKVDGIEGSSNIADIFQKKDTSLSNCVPFDPHQMAALLEETNLDIGNTVGRCSTSFIIDDINSSILLRKPGGLSGCSSDHIINGTRKLRDHITIVLTIMIFHRFSPI